MHDLIFFGTFCMTAIIIVSIVHGEKKIAGSMADKLGEVTQQLVAVLNREQTTNNNEVTE